MDRKGGKKDASHKIYSVPHNPIYDAYSINRAVDRASKDHNFLDNAVKLLDGLKFPTFKNNIINHVKKATKDHDTISLFESLDGYIEFNVKYRVRKSMEVNDPEYELFIDQLICNLKKGYCEYMGYTQICPNTRKSLN